MLETGIPKLDKLLGGGIPRGRTLIYYAYPGVEGKVFGMQTLYNHLKKHHSAIFLTTSCSPTPLFKELKEFGWNFFAYLGEKFRVIDSYSPFIGTKDELGIPMDETEVIESYTLHLLREMENIGEPTLVVVDSLSTIMDLCGEYETLEAVREWNRYAKIHEHVIVYNFTAWPYSEDVLQELKENTFEATIMIGGIAERVIFGQYFGLLKAEWTPAERKSVLFKVVRPGGIRVYVPKIVVTGPHNAGKSTFIRALSTEAVSVDRLGTTVALDRGHVEYKGLSVDLFGTPGQERFDPLLKIIGGEAMGVFLVVDSTKSRDFVRAKQMLESIKAYGLPFVVIANKQDLPDALSPEEIRERFSLPRNVDVIPTIASDGVGVFEALERLVDRIMEDGINEGGV